MLVLIGSLGAVMATTGAAIFFTGLALFDLETARTMTFTALVAKEYLVVAVLRAHEGASFRSNRWLLLAVAVSLSLQVALLYTPLGTLFGAVPLGIEEWAVIAAGLLVAAPTALIIGRLVRRRFGPL
jgi:Ca2+-transporting ATPase